MFLLEKMKNKSRPWLYILRILLTDVKISLMVSLCARDTRLVEVSLERGADPFPNWRKIRDRR